MNNLSDSQVLGRNVGRRSNFREPLGRKKKIILKKTMKAPYRKKSLHNIRISLESKDDVNMGISL